MVLNAGQIEILKSVLLFLDCILTQDKQDEETNFKNVNEHYFFRPVLFSLWTKLPIDKKHV